MSSTSPATRRRFLGSLALVAGGALSSGRAGADTGTSRADAATRPRLATTFVGRVEGSDAYIAIVKDGRKVGGYVCNDGPGGEWIAYSWLRRGSAALRGKRGEVVGRVTVRGDRVAGTVDVAGQRRRFSARRTRADGPGLYFGVGLQQDALLVGGWVLLPDGTQRGAVSGVETRTLRALPTVRAPRLSLDEDETAVALPGGGGPTPPVVEPEQLVVINIIAILIGLLLPAVQK